MSTKTPSFTPKNREAESASKVRMDKLRLNLNAVKGYTSGADSEQSRQRYLSNDLSRGESLENYQTLGGKKRDLGRLSLDMMDAQASGREVDPFVLEPNQAKYEDKTVNRLNQTV